MKLEYIGFLNIFKTHKGEVQMTSYIQEVFDRVKARNSSEPEFLQAVEEVFHSLAPVLEKNPQMGRSWHS